MYYEVKVQFEFDNGKGKTQKKTEAYLVDAMSVTEAEARIVEHFKSSVVEYEVKSASVSKIVEVIESPSK
jgi:hypothetical protein